MAACRGDNLLEAPAAEGNRDRPELVARSPSDEAIVLGRRHSVRSALLGETREIFVSVPPGYDERNSTYPVVVVLDGEIHFEHIAGLVRFLSRSAEMPHAIVVGISNTDRTRDFTPPGGADAGRADDFLRSLETELLPWLDENYRTVRHRILVGHSTAGLFAAHAFATHPELFRGYVIVSATLFWNGEAVVRRAAERLARHRSLPRDLFVAVSCCESASSLTSVLQESAPADLRWEAREFPDESHASVVHPAVQAGLESLFAAWSETWTRSEGGLGTVDDHLKSLSERWGHGVEIGYDQAIVMAWRAMDGGKPNAGIAMLEYAARSDPSNPVAYGFLGIFHQRSGRLTEAVRNLGLGLEKARARSDPNLADYERALEAAQRELAAGAHEP